MWKVNIKYPKYEINQNGSIRNAKSLKVLKYNNNGTGYMKVKLSGKPVYVHRVIADTFIPNPLNLPQVNHIDGNKCNNCVTNLEWVSQSDNIKHAFSTGAMTSNLAEYNECRARGF